MILSELITQIEATISAVFHQAIKTNYLHIYKCQLFYKVDDKLQLNMTVGLLQNTEFIK